MKLSKYIWTKIKDFFIVEEEPQLGLDDEIWDVEDEEVKPKRKPKTDICNLKTCKKKLNMLNGFK